MITIRSLNPSRLAFGFRKAIQANTDTNCAFLSCVLDYNFVISYEATIAEWDDLNRMR